ncbi:akt1 substrate 1 protein [Anaeramoeba flamelloides]|uniref:Akt1 substrate 1 protein n=1 Tax=Anaeramoeba flamelloides TaxID=1746091 RepID=A0ABQ8XM48_9EUKA|nr:akt1 substrate 1 protein [Anaeramoeba flamelloides]
MNNQNVLCSCLNLHLEIQETNSLLDSKKTINQEIIEILEDPIFSTTTINGHQIKNKTEQELILTNKNYSKTFKIILPQETTKTEIGTIMVEEKTNNEQFEKELMKLNQQMKQILNHEKEKMSQELEKFKQRQENQFEQLKFNLEKEKQTLWSSILKIQNNNKELGITTDKPESVEKRELKKEKHNKVKEKEEEEEKETEKEKEIEKEKEKENEKPKTSLKNNKKKTQTLIKKSIKQRPQKNKKMNKYLSNPNTIEMKGEKIIFKQNYKGLKNTQTKKKKKQRTKKFKKKFDKYESNYIPYFNFSMEDNGLFNKKFDKFNSDEEKEGEENGSGSESTDDDDDDDEDNKRFNEIFAELDNIKTTTTNNKQQKNEKDELGNIARSVPIPIFLNQVMERGITSNNNNKNDGFIEPHKYIQAQQSQTELDLSKSFNVPLKRVPTWRIANSVSAFRSNIFDN